jgi:transcriptional regulator with XRE-family HTH domain
LAGENDGHPRKIARERANRFVGFVGAVEEVALYDHDSEGLALLSENGALDFHGVRDAAFVIRFFASPTLEPTAILSTLTRFYFACIARIACEVDILGVHPNDYRVPPDPIYTEIGLLIRARRKALDLRQKSLASELGISRGSLANIETGRQSILVHQLYRFATALRLPPHDLLPLLHADQPAMARTDVSLPAFTLGVGSAAQPADLKAQQKKQVTAFFTKATPNSQPSGERTHAKIRKRQSR